MESDPLDRSEATAKHSILLVDDEPLLLECLFRTLRREPYSVFLAYSAEQALGLLERHTIDLVLADLGMPDIDGLTLLNRIHLRYPQIVRVLVTGDPGWQERTEAFPPETVQACFLKPWRCRELRDELRCCFERLAGSDSIPSPARRPPP